MGGAVVMKHGICPSFLPVPGMLDDLSARRGRSFSPVYPVMTTTFSTV